ncbi:LPS-assembly protein LptD [Simiduia sp. 21SJ11W-1]|uniref:LPS-assembly protein LptD n=1 Tax=Simiduia sp. 21SJ11W-1 TaxID=2909669 RepID=UPI0020A118B9|nr:LPS-assembly protein LptD [Simiduia sp. 21SJ11W-1]UTA48604.1 LPS-assembly protein LptD [Simiduia sp. 21SJ11W-1]
MTFPFPQQPLSLAVRLGLCATVLLAQQANADDSPYQAGADGDMFAGSRQVHAQGRAALDWVPKAELTDAQASCRAGCDGAYVAPMRTDAEAGLKPEQAPVRAAADDSRWLQESKAELTGNVEVIQGYRSLSADRAVYDQANQTAEIEGHVVVREPGLVVFADRLMLDEGRGSAVLENTQFVLHEAHMRGKATTLAQQQGRGIGENLYQLEDGSFTMCSPEDNTWLVRGAEIEIDTATGQGKARHMRLELADVPVFYAPYFRFPATDKRMTGLLFPTIASDSRNGFEYAQPLYLNLAPNYDLTLTPRWMQHRGLGIEAEGRHLSSLFETAIGGAYLADDKGGENDKLQEKADAGEISQADVTPYKGQDRWLAHLQQRGGRGRDWSTVIDYTQVSDVDYLRDLDTGSIETSSRTHLRQAGSLHYQLPDWRLGLNLEAYQSVSLIGVEPYRKLPQLTANGQYQWGDWELALNHDYTQFAHSDTYWDQTDDNPDDIRIVGDRLRTDYRLGWRAETIWGFLRPAVMVKHLQYALDETTLRADANATPGITGAQASIDAGLFFEREGSLFEHGYIQTFEPRVFYFNSPEQDHSDLYRVTDRNRSVQFDTTETTFSYNQLFRESRFNGGDRIDDANQTSVGLTTRFIEASSGIERFRASLGQIFYAANRNVTLSGVADEAPRSEIAGQLAAHIGEHWRFNLDIAYSQENYKPSQGTTSLRYVDPAGYVVNLGYRYQRKGLATDQETGELFNNNIDQTDIGIVYPLSDQWNLMARSFYDHALGREIDTFAGVEYNSCCYRVRVVGRRWTDSRDIQTLGPSSLELDRGIYIEFQLKGLGSLGRRLDELLTEGIIGFDQRPQYEP